MDTTCSQLFKQQLECLEKKPATISQAVPKQEDISENLRGFIKENMNSVPVQFANDRAALTKQGFSVTDSNHRNFASAFLNLYSSDVNVLVTTDSILHAWQCSFGKILEKAEINFLFPQLEILLTKCLSTVKKSTVNSKYSKDLVFYFEVALEILKSKSKLFSKNKPSGGKNTPVIRMVENIIQSNNSPGLVTLSKFNQEIPIDFSHFTPRGHYEKNATLRLYFMSMMWLGKFMFTVDKENPDSLVPILSVIEVLQKSDSLQIWQEMENIMQSFMGSSDNMTVNDICRFVQFHKIDISQSLESAENLKEIHKKILGDETFITRQEYVSTPLETPDFNTPVPSIPIVFALFGQRFGYDSWAMSQFVYDKIKNEKNQLVIRKMSSCVDVAYSVFENDFAGSVLDERMKSKEPCSDDSNYSYSFRDGMDFSKNLNALRNVTSSLSNKFWDSSFYMNWLDVLRSLSSSNDPLEELYPEAMKTIDYQRKNLNTQLSSYSILKYESVLYIKPPTPMLCGCNVPRGYVEPKVLFWKKFIRHVTQIREVLSPKMGMISESLAPFLDKFIATLETLLNISIKELNRECLNKEEGNWLRKVVEAKIGGSGMGSQTGWYYDLFFSCSAFKKHNVLSDIMTDYPDPNANSPGGILHAGIYGVDFLCVAIEDVGVDNAHDVPGKHLSLMQRKYSSNYTNQRTGFSRFNQPKSVELPSHQSTFKRVQGWEDQVMPIKDNGDFSSEDLSNIKNFKANNTNTSNAFFVGPVFRYHEFVGSVEHRITKREWSNGYHSQVSRPAWFKTN